MEKLSFDQLPQAVNSLLRKIDRLESLLLKQQAVTNPEPAKPLCIEEAAEFLNLKKTTLYSKVSRGELPHIKKSGRLYFLREDLLNYLKSGRTKSKSEALECANEILTPKRS